MKRILLAAALCAASPAYGQSALEFAATGMGRSISVAPQKMNKRFARRLIRSESMLAGVYAPLADKAREIEASCGSRVISGVRHTRVRGSGRWSLHASGKAIDMAGNPGCIYAHLRGWRGGYSTDYGRVKHVHISLGGREDGARFAHYSGRRRYAWRRTRAARVLLLARSSSEYQHSPGRARHHRTSCRWQAALPGRPSSPRRRESGLT